MVGLFINTLPLRAEVAEGEPLGAWLERLQQRQLELGRFEATPLVEIQRWGGVPPGQALFESILVFENYPLDEALRGAEGRLPIRVVRSQGQTNYPLTIVVVPGDGLWVRATYDDRRIDSETVRRMFAQLRTLLEEFVSGIDRPVAELAMIPEAERQRLLVAWNRTDTPYCGDRCVHELFEDQAEQAPNAVAVAFGEERLSYAELDSMANRLARHLRSRGVGPDSRVGLSTGRSLKLAIGLLGILKAGGAYVPLDPSYPDERLGFMARDAGLTLLLTTTRDPAGFRGVEVPVVSLDDHWPTIAEHSDDKPHAAASGDNLAYLIYTSGSTGKPKGVAMTHRSLTNLVQWQLARSRTGTGSTLQFSPISFDVSFQECFATWAARGTLLLIGEDQRRDPWVLLDLIEREGIGRIFLPFVALQQLAVAAAGSGRRLPDGCEVITAGEQLAATPAIRDLVQASRATLENQYGPTETHVVTAYRLPQDVGTWENLPPIGQAIANARVYVLDAKLRPVPIGVPGELFLGGVCLARGYFQRPGPTAERFVPDPFSPWPSRRMYRTGDLARFRDDGELEFLGRMDQQVKVHGYRIEPGEIEAVLSKHPAVRQCAVVPGRDAAGAARLVAFAVAVPEAEPTVEDLLGHLARRLPDYMVPAAVILLDTLPTTPSGKVDRRRLSVDEVPLPIAPASFVPPGDPIEQALAEIWRGVLGRDRVGVHDSFFALGGHSLKATQAISRIRTALKINLPVRAIFEDPTIAGVARRIAAARRGKADQPLTPIERIARDADLPLSCAQQRLWFLDQYMRGNVAYNIPAVLHLRGPLNVEALRLAFEELIRRHEALRTTFGTRGGQPVQHVHPASRWDLAVKVLDVSPQAGPMDEAQRRAQLEIQGPFDLERGPLIRTALLRWGEVDWLLMVTMHHIVSDGWSIGVLIRELAALYAAFRDGSGSPFPELSIQYVDFAAWQNKRLDGGDLLASAAYWRDRLTGHVTLCLPTDRPRPPVQTYRGVRLGFALPESVGMAVMEFSRGRDATPFMTLLAAFQVLLGRYSGQDDICVGTPVANRTCTEIEPLIGLFVNTIVLRVDLSGDPTFAELVERVRDAALDGYAHQEFPFERLVEALGVERDPSRTPLFQVAFVLQNAADGPPAIDGLEVEPLDIDLGAAKFDLVLSLHQAGTSFHGSFEFNADLFDDSTVRRMQGHYVRLLEASTTHPSRRLSELPMVTAAEQDLILGWQAPPAEPPGETCMHKLVKEQATRSPEAVALRCGPEQVTYGELNAQADRLARRLRALGVGPEARVGILLERSPDLVVGMLGIWKAGGAFVPLEPSHPESRRAFVLRDAGLAVLVSRSGLRERAGSNGALLVCLDEDLAEDRPAEEPPAPKSPDGLAYVIYTSGSTGEPKGVEVTHRSLVNLCEWHRDAFGVTPSARASQVASAAFDAMLWEIWPYLAVGACVDFVAPDVVSEPARLADLLARRRITHAFAPTPLAEELLGLPWPEDLGLEVLLTGGDRLLRAASAGLPFRVVNNYGPTEATVVATSGDDLRTWGRPGPPPVGRPIRNVRAYVLDAHLHPVPVKVHGELYLGGPSLARGYRGRPASTAERFLPDPFDSRPGARMYRTGDRVRWMDNGQIEFLGRVDAQLKVRGYRIEPAEIESALLAHPAVYQAAVDAQPRPSGEKQLVAYIVPREGEAPAAALRDHLRALLPEYMVPTAFVSLSRLPLNPNGKVDRGALPAPDDSSNGNGSPRTPTEDLLREIWCAVLGVPSVDRGDNFFERGGHSLLAARLLARIRSVFQIDLALRAVFESPSLGEQARLIDRRRREDGREGVIPPLWAEADDGDRPLSFAQERLWFLDQLEPGTAAHNLATTLRLEGRLDPGALRRALEEVVARHEILRTTYEATDGGPRQVIHPPSPWELAGIDLSTLPPSDRSPALQRLAGEEAGRPFDLSRDRVLRTTLVRLADDMHVLLIVLHHIAADGWSMGLLMREVAERYRVQVHETTPPSTPAPAVSYADFARWQRRWLQGDRLARELEYWRGHLAGASILALPTDRPRPGVQTYHGARVEFELGADLVEGIRRLSRVHEVTVFMALLAAFKVLLARWSGQSDISVGTPVSNRPLSELESMIGLCVNTLVLRTDLAGAPSFADLLARVRGVALGAYAHQDLPLERLVEALHVERDLSRPPLFQVMLAYQVSPLEAVEMPGLRLAMEPVPTGAARIDLTLDLVQDAQSIRASLEYNTDLFDKATIRRMADQFTILLRAAIAEPERCIWDLELLTPAEGRWLVEAWDGTVPAVASLEDVVLRFETQAKRTPNAPAVIARDGTLSYAELDRQADRLARHLNRCGIRPESRVGLCVPRSRHLVVAVLGVLKSGGAYLPLDPDLPGERLAYMIEDSRVACLVTTRELAQALPAGAAATIVLEDALPEDCDQDAGRAGHPASELLPGHPAYVLYTSGSTGRPKGVVVSHGALANFLEAMRERPGMGASDVVLAVTSLSFDIAGLELLLPLIVGGRVVLAGHDDAGDGRLLLDLIRRHGVTVLQGTPATWRLLLTAGWEGGEGLRALCGGEALPGDLAREILQRAGALWNLYGPTETTIWSSAERVEEGRDSPLPTISLGRPVRNTRLYVLDARFRPAPAGVSSELFIGGDGVARGYLGRPGLTAERFLPDPFARRAGARMYRTGDLVRSRPDGGLEFLGRLDGQVKIRGHRIDIGEVEAALRQHPQVQDAVVDARGPSDQRRLVAYVVPDNAGISTSSLRSHLETKLPDYMIPAVFLEIGRLPLTPSGKVDRRALPEPTDERPALDVAYVLPRTPLEELLAEAWKEVLEVERVGVHDDFFALGGHSLLATRLVGRIESTFRIRIPLLEMFREPTVAALASQLAHREPRPGHIAAILKAWARLRAMTAEEQARLLAERRDQAKGGDSRGD
jgi:amino acid adenylation domain-containing protein